jgi:hypothetical protein
MIISNTQVSMKNLCDKAHHFRFVRDSHGYEPKKFPIPIYRGILGHSALEQYYLQLKDGKPVEECRDAALSVLDNEIRIISTETPEEFELIKIVIQLRQLIEAYAEVYRKEPFRVLEVEQEYQTSVGLREDIKYGLKLDLLVEMTSGQYRGDLVVVDHKFVYNFKTTLDIEMDAQLPKYIYTLRQNGYTVTKGMFNQVRTRGLKNPGPEDLYRREWLKSSKAEVSQIWDEQSITAARIADDINWSRTSIRTLSLLVCRSCMFQGPCKAELNGDDVTQMLEANYQKSSYGYSDLSDA